MSGTSRGRRSRIVAVVFIAAAVATTAGPAPGAWGGAGRSSPADGATSAAAGWQAVTLEPFVARAELDPTDADAGGVATTSGFRLTSLDATHALELATGLSVEPSVALRIEGAADAPSVMLYPVEPLLEGRDHRFTLRSAEGALLGSWVFRTQAPLRVVGTLPQNGGGGVPVDTGIEIVFDRPGARDVDRYFDIQPPVKGRFEMHDETLAFIPRSRLANDTVYRVTLRAGVPVAGSRMRLADDLRFEFKTRPIERRRSPRIDFVRDIGEASTTEAPILQVESYGRRPGTVIVDVHRLASLEAAIEAARAAQGAFRWDESLDIPTDHLRSVGSYRLDLQGDDEYGGPGHWVELPDPLPAGWYVVTLKDDRGDARMVLQVSDLAVFAQTSETRSLAWVNDARSGGPVEGATLSLDDGTPLGRTDADGLATFESSAPILGTEPYLLVVRDAERGVLVPFAGGGWSSQDILPCWSEGPYCGEPRDLDPDRFWSLLYTDREQYRATDTIGVFGMIRERDTARIPDELEVRLMADSDDPMAAPAVARAAVIPAGTGAFGVQLPVSDLPYDWYELELVIDGEVVASHGIEVAPIVKPDYQLDLSTDRRVAIAGQAVGSSVRATFFDGTAVPGVPVRMSLAEASSSGTTDGFGSLSERLPARAPGDRWSQWEWQVVEAWPARGEEAEISAEQEVLVFRSAFVISANAQVRGDRATLEGTVDRVALGRLQADEGLGPDADLDPRGDPVAGVPVTATVTELIPVRTQTGTVYDFISKRVVPTYRYHERREPRGTFELVTDEAGRFWLGFPVDRAHGYVVDLEAADASGRATRTRVRAQEAETKDWTAGVVYVAPPGIDFSYFPDDQDPPAYALGEPVVLDFHVGGEPQPTGGRDRYLFTVGQRGLQRALVQDGPRLSVPFEAQDVPSVTVGGVRWTGSTYLADAWGWTARFRPDDRKVDVALSADRPSYGPGEAIALDLRTTGADGEPVAADVVVRVVDEKLFAIGAAQEVDPLADLYAPVDAGWLASYASHQLPRGSADGGFGDAGAGGAPRGDFRDSLLFRLVSTDESGRARVTFGLSDDLTSWRVGATALTQDLGAGEASLRVPVGLPFFVQLVSAPEYLAGDRPFVRLRSYGAGLEEGDRVRFTLDPATLGGSPVTAEAAAFEEVTVPLPPLVPGTHHVTASGSSGSGDGTLSDALERTVGVVGSHLETGRLAQALLEGRLSPSGGPGLTSVVVTDAGRGRFQGPLTELASSLGPRADQVLAATEARRILVDAFGVDPATLPGVRVSPAAFQGRQGGISLLPYSSADLELSMLVALAAPGTVDREGLTRYLEREGSARGVSRPRAIMALAGLAALGAPVLDGLREAAALEGLGIEERLHVAIGLAEAGDQAAAVEMERALLAEAGQQRGSRIRLLGERPPDTSELTALLSILAAGVGDDAVAAAADAYVAADPPRDTLASLQRVAFTTRSLERAVAEPARFAWTLGDERRVIDLGPGETFSLSLTADQLADLVLESLEGTMTVTSTWSEPLEAEDLATQDPAVSVRRTVTPAGTVPADGTVEVRLDVELDEAAAAGCYLVTEQVPAGLAPVWEVRGRGRGSDQGVEGPWEITGQRVTFCAYRDLKDPVTELRYAARVVTPGSYAWEPTVVRSVEAPESWRLGEAGRVVTE